jgi:hypothetical protein
VETLRQWARGDFYPLSHATEWNALDELADEMINRPKAWWHAFEALYPELDEQQTRRLDMPLGALLHVAGDDLQQQIAADARRDRRIANVFWHAMHDLR